MQSDVTPEKLKMIATMEVAHGLEKVSNTIDGLTSASLKRVLKTVCHVHLAENLLDRDSAKLEEVEQGLVDKIFALQESVLGYQTLMNELEGNTGNSVESEEVSENKENEDE